MGEPPLAGRTLAGWRLLRPLGQGAHGTVYLASDASGALVALKLVALDSSHGASAARKAFLRGADIARGLAHPHVVAVLDAGVQAATGWLAMEPVLGGDLAAHTRALQLLPALQVLAVGQQVAQALACAHAQGVVHRDLKPANVLRMPGDPLHVKLGDFGLARVADAAGTGTGIVPGTPAYMAPEQLAGALPSVQTDLYALGVLLFQLLSGRLPHDATSMGELLRQVALEPAAPLQPLVPGLAPAAAALVAGLLAKSPARRPASAADVAGALQAILHVA